VRVTTAFNRLLALQGARVIDVLFGPDGVTVRVALRRRRAVCSACGQVCRRVHDRASRRWRHLDLAGQRCQLEYELRRVRCPDCGVRVEAVPWARAGARHTRDFEDLVAFCAQQMAKTPICALLRIGWDTVGAIVERVVADHLDGDRLAGLVMIGVDEISYRKGQRYLTQVCDHQSGAIVWAKPGRNAQTLQAFFDQLGERRESIRAISIDMNGGYEKAIRERQATDERFDPEVCFDPFHVVQLAGRAVDEVRRTEWNAQGKSKTGHGRWVKSVRWSLLKRHPPSRPSTNSPPYTKSSTPTAASTAPSCSRKSCGCSTTSTTPGSRPSTSRPGSRGPHAQSSSRSSSSPARSAATATASSPRSDSGSPTAASKPSTPKSGCSPTAASASTDPGRSSPSSTSAAPAWPSTSHSDDIHTNNRSACFFRELPG